jgi:hypothetical protein
MDHIPGSSHTVIYNDNSFEHCILGWLESEEGSDEYKCEEGFAILIDYGLVLEVIRIIPVTLLVEIEFFYQIMLTGSNFCRKNRFR